MFPTNNKPPLKKNLSRKELRKEMRLQKKQKKIEYFLNKKVIKDKIKKDKEPGRFVKIHKDGLSEEVVKVRAYVTKTQNDKSQELLKENEKEKQKWKSLQKEMRKQRIKALNQDNKREDKTIKQLEKKLKLNKRKSKTISKAFVDCGLDYILDVCDSENIQAAVTAEKNLQDSDSEYEEDLAYITGKKNEKTKAKTLSAKEKENDTKKNCNDENSEEDGEGELLSDYSEEEENISDEEMFENDIQENSDICQESNSEDEDEEDQSGEDSSVELYEDNEKNNSAKNYVKDLSIENKKKTLPLESSKNLKSVLNSNKNKEKVLKASENPNILCKEESSKKRKVSISEVASKEKKIRSDNDPECMSGSASELEENLDGEDEEQKEFWEDIYGRIRDKSGNIVEESKGKYIPPHLRSKSDSEDSKKREELEKIRKQLKGLLNRLAENNMHSISNQIDEMYMRQSRYDMNETMLNLYLESLIAYVHTPERLIMEHAMLIAILQANVGTEIGAFFLQNLGKKFNELHSQGQDIENKMLDNLLLLLCHLYTFKVYHCELLYDILGRLCNSFKPKDVDLILVILRSVGFTLRKDDPIALKELIIRVQKLANQASAMKDDARVRFMLDVLLGIKNNNMNKIPGYDPTHAEHLKKIIKAMFRKGNYITELKISLDDLLKADERGRWWIVGSAWSGPAPHSSEKEETNKQLLPVFSQEVLELARKQRMNTSNRKTIFCILMTAEDYLDAFEKLIKLGLKGQPEQEIVHVLIHCSLNENTYNPYYALIAEQLCISDRRHQLAIQYAVWDRFKELTNLKKFQITNLAKFLAHLFLQKSLPISVLKVVEFVELDKSGVRLIRQVLMSILLHEDKDSMTEVFSRIAKPKKLAPLRQSLALFLHHFILRNKSISENSSPEEKLLKENVGQVIKVLNCFSELF